MPFFRREQPISRDYFTAPAEHLISEARILELDERILGYRRTGQLVMVDRLLDMRNAIRPPRVAQPPVIPGRPQ